MNPIDERAFWAWCRSKSEFAANGMQGQYGDAVTQKIKEVNWQMKKIDEAQQKMVNLLFHSGPLGKMILAYMSANYPEFKEVGK